MLFFRPLSTEAVITILDNYVGFVGASYLFPITLAFLPDGRVELRTVLKPQIDVILGILMDPPAAYWADDLGRKEERSVTVDISTYQAHRMVSALARNLKKVQQELTDASLTFWGEGETTHITIRSGQSEQATWITDFLKELNGG